MIFLLIQQLNGDVGPVSRDLLMFNVVQTIKKIVSLSQQQV